MEKLAHRIAVSEETRGSQRGDRDTIRQAIAENGGDRIESIKREIGEKRAVKDERVQRASRYDERATRLGLATATDADTFLANRHAIQEAREAAEAAQLQAQNGLTEIKVELRKLQDQYEELEAELQSLYQRRSNIPRQILEMRAEMCRHTGLHEEELPFAGELLQVRAEERIWEGAIERLLHGFGLSLLVRDEHYGQVSQWVEANHLGGRLVYFRILRARPADHNALHAASLVHKLAVKPESGFYAWLDAELAARFNYACCDTVEQFRREPQAVTRGGQIKGRGERHEKDDRYRIDDRSRYVLGWSNAEKIDALKSSQRRLEQLRAPLVARIQKMEQQRDAAQNRKTQLAELRRLRELPRAGLAAAGLGDRTPGRRASPVGRRLRHSAHAPAATGGGRSGADGNRDPPAHRCRSTEPAAGAAAARVGLGGRVRHGIGRRQHHHVRTPRNHECGGARRTGVDRGNVRWPRAADAGVAAGPHRRGG